MNYLSEASLRTVLPDYEQVFRVIKEIREAAGEAEFTQEEYEHFPYRNVISVWGERGSGKTSVFMTLRMLLENDKRNLNTIKDYEQSLIEEITYEGDNHLSLIVPEMLEEGTELLGVILLKVKQIIDSKKNGNKHHGKNYESCIYNEKDELDKLWDKVFSTYLMRAEGYTSIASENYTNFYDYSLEREKSLRSEIELREKIYELFTKISENCSKKQKSMLYIYIDDADINQYRCAETINTILRYLKHPNVIVFLSGDMQKMERELYWAELKDESKLKNYDTILSNDIQKTKRQYIYDLLKKVLPHSGRFYLKKLTNEEKKSLRYPGKGKEITFEKQLQIVFGFQEEKLEESKNGTKLEDVMLDSVYGIFDYKPRGIITVWDYLKNENMDRIGHKKYFYDILLDKIIITNDKLRAYEDIIKKCITIQEKRDETKKVECKISFELFLHYIYMNIQSFVGESKEQEEEKEKRKEQFVEIVHLFYFMEKLVQSPLIDENQEIKESVLNDGRGKDYAELLNAILDIKDHKKVYYNAISSVEVLTLYNRLIKQFTIKEQGEIYRDKRYFSTYVEILKDMNQNPMEKSYDFEWRELLTNEKAMNEGYQEQLTKDVMEMFQGIKFDYRILEENEKVLGINSDETRKQLEEIGNDKLGQIEQYIVIQRLNDCIKEYAMEYGIVNNLSEVKEKVLKKLEESSFEQLGKLFNSNSGSNYFEETKYNYDIQDYLKIKKEKENFEKFKKKKKETLEDSMKKKSTENSKMEYFAGHVVEIFDIVRRGAIYHREKNAYVNGCTCKNILNVLENRTYKIQINQEIYNYYDSILEKLQIGDKEKIDDKEKNRFKELILYFKEHKDDVFKKNETLVEGYNSTQDNQDKIKHLGSETMPLFNKKLEKYIIDGKVVVVRIESLNKDNNGWETRRYNALWRIMRLLEDIYIETKCEEFIRDFWFINEFEIEECLKKQSKPYTYEYINTYIYNLFHRNVEPSKKGEILKFISDIKNKVSAQEKYYYLHEIDLDILDEMRKKVDNADIKVELDVIQQTLLSEKKIKQEKLNDFIERFEFYLSALQEKQSNYNANVLQVICDKLITRDETIDSAEKLEDVEQNEMKRILQLEVDATVRAYKNYLEQQ